jgi:hypothetical protein
VIASAAASGAMYSFSHMDNFDARRMGIEVGIGAPPRRHQLRELLAPQCRPLAAVDLSLLAPVVDRLAAYPEISRDVGDLPSPELWWVPPLSLPRFRGQGRWTILTAGLAVVPTLQPTDCRLCGDQGTPRAIAILAPLGAGKTFFLGAVFGQFARSDASFDERRDKKEVLATDVVTPDDSGLDVSAGLGHQALAGVLDLERLTGEPRGRQVLVIEELGGPHAGAPRRCQGREDHRAHDRDRTDPRHPPGYQHGTRRP